MRTDLVRSNLCPRQLAPSAAGRNKVTKTRGHPLKPSSKARLVQLTIRAQLHLPLHTILRSEACNSSLSRSSCLGRLVSAVSVVLPRSSCPSRLVSVVLSRLSCPGRLIPVVLSQSSCPCRLVSVVWSSCLTRLSRLVSSSYLSLVSVVVSRSSGLCRLVSVVLSHRLISVLSQSSCLSRFGRLVSVSLTI